MHAYTNNIVVQSAWKKKKLPRKSLQPFLSASHSICPFVRCPERRVQRTSTPRTQTEMFDDRPAGERDGGILFDTTSSYRYTSREQFFVFFPFSADIMLVNEKFVFKKRIFYILEKKTAGFRRRPNSRRSYKPSKIQPLAIGIKCRTTNTRSNNHKAQ